jgi:hypothetical protein
MVFMVVSHHSNTVVTPARRSPWLFNTHLQWIQPFEESRTTPGIATKLRRLPKKIPLATASDRHLDCKRGSAEWHLNFSKSLHHKAL